MKQNSILTLTSILFLVVAASFAFTKKHQIEDDRFISYQLDPKKQDIKLYWKDNKNENFRSIQNLKLWLANNQRKLVFAMNAGMYKQDNSPQGLFIENQRTKSPLDTTSGSGNFYLKPNGVFYITTDNIPVICNSTDFNNNGKIKYATQSGP
ncbi:MAG: phosphodiester glycosidase family protein, partial [Ferruginibacter sp.]